MKYYIVDTTLTNRDFIFENLSGLVTHLEGTVKRKFNLDRAHYMQNLIDLGYGYDDPEGATFTQSLSEFFNIGIFRQGKPLRTNVHEAAGHNKFRTELGD